MKTLYHLVAYLKSAFLLSVIAAITALVFACETPNNQLGDCKPLNQCQPLKDILERRPISRKDNDYLRKSICGFDGIWPKVCCPKLLERSIVAPKRKTLLPSKDVCGTLIQNRIIGGSRTDLDEFPWMVLLEYQKRNGSSDFYCGGVLISERYVLTAAHCITGAITKTLKLISVRLGEYNIETNPDCVNYGLDRECAPPPVDIPVEEQIVHGDYNPDNISKHNDIALLRLKNPVTFTDFIKPICLPTTPEELNKTYSGEKLTVCGWGKTEFSSESNIKLKVKIPVKENSQCEVIYRKFGIRIGEGHLCAGGERGRDSCRGDSGGPLMAEHLSKDYDIHWYVVGIVSFGITPCGRENWPGVYTNVPKYTKWILSKLKP